MQQQKNAGLLQEKLDKWQLKAVERKAEEARERLKQRTAWRIEGTLGSSRSLSGEPLDLTIRYTAWTHQEAWGHWTEEEKPSWQKKKEDSVQRKKEEKRTSLRTAFEANDLEGTGR